MRKTQAVWLRTAFCILASLVCFNPRACRAETLRVTTWNLGLEPPDQGAEIRLQQAAAILRELKPDVILLQQINGWRGSIALTELLQPLQYRVLVCSAFPGPSTNSLAEPQVAILSRQNAYFTWNETWPGSHAPTGGQGGVVFAAIEAGGQHIGIFNALLGAENRAKQASNLLLAEIAAIKAWETNQIQTFVVGGSVGSKITSGTRLMTKLAAKVEPAGLVQATDTLPLDAHISPEPPGGNNPAPGDILMAGPAGFPNSPHVFTAPGFSHRPVTCEVELDPEKVALAFDVRAESKRQHEAEQRAKTRWVVIGAAVIAAAWFALSRTLRKRGQRKIDSARAAKPQPRADLEPKPMAGAVRPIIFVNSPAKPHPAEPPAASAPVRPVLRIQNPARASSDRNPAQDAQPKKTEVEAEPEEPRAALEVTPLIPTRRLAPADPEVRQGVIRELAGWLKQKFVRKLVEDRKQLMQAHELAAKMASTLDNRLARIEAQIQQQNQAYIRRIDDLNRELAVAREENRELIRERIAQVKAEMEASRAKMLAEANLDNTSMRL